MSRQYDVYGLGHALVDVQYQVTAEFLRRSGIDKGVMTLVDEARRQALLQALRDPPVASSSGGSAANTLIGLASFGGRACFACRLGEDEWGDFYQQDLEKAGVRSTPGDRAGGPTGQCLVFITPDADRTMNTFLGVSSSLAPEQIDEAAAADSQYVYLEGYLVTSESGFAACTRAQELAHRHRTGVALTLSDPHLVHSFKARLEPLVARGVDLLFCNEDEARAFTGCADRLTAGRALASLSPSLCITCGAEGALVCQDHQTIFVPGVHAQVVDTTGAGDMFAGSVLFGLTHGHCLAESAWLGNCAAARVVAQYGPRLEQRLQAQLPDFLARFPLS